MVMPSINIDDQLRLHIYPNHTLTLTLTDAKRHAQTADSNSSSELAFSYLYAPGTTYARFDKVFNIILAYSRV